MAGLFNNIFNIILNLYLILNIFEVYDTDSILPIDKKLKQILSILEQMIVYIFNKEKNHHI